MKKPASQTILYYTILYYTILYYTILYYTIYLSALPSSEIHLCCSKDLEKCQ